MFRDVKQPITDRVQDLISQLTLEEKVSMMMYNSEAIPRLGIPAYNWWNEALHGVARAGRATVFPQAIGMAATFDTDLIFRISSAISDEARAMHHAAAKKDNRVRYAGLTFWTPNINIFRDARWGRGQETYGEDPFLTSQLAVQFVKGLQGDHPKYLKTAACAKHFAVHSGPEKDRHVFNARSTPKDLYETYLPAFKTLVDAGVEAVMCAYNRTNDEACCGSKTLLGNILREEWGFKGHIVSDCWAIVDFHDGHKITETPAESAALALKSGVNLNCGNTFPHLLDAIKQGLVSEADFDNSLTQLLPTLFKLGFFDPEEMNPYTSISTDVINSDAHRALALEAAQKSVVLLKNKNNTLPLDKGMKSVFVVGPSAATVDVLIANYYGLSGRHVTILDGIAAKVEPGSFVGYKHGFLLDRENVNPHDWTIGDAQGADAMIVVMGISGLLEGEEGESIASPHAGDREDIRLPQSQIDYLKRLCENNEKPVIVVLTGGSPIAIPEVSELADAVLFAWYPGEEGGTAVADVIYGDVSPSGKLPVTFPASLDQLPPYDDYNMQGRTYRYIEDAPLYPFGFGLSYTEFTYSDISTSAKEIKSGESLEVSVTITNTGSIAGDEVVQLYLTDLEASAATPFYALKGFQRLHLQPQESQTPKFTITPEMMALVTNEGESILEPGEFKITIGGASPGPRSEMLGAPEPVTSIFTLR